MDALASILRLNNALNKHYQQLNHEHYNFFFKYCFDEEMIDDKLPMWKELGPESTAENCFYTWLHLHHGFPVPNNLSIPTNKMEEHAFHILQCCSQHGKPPSDKCMIRYCSPMKKSKNISTAHHFGSDHAS